MRTPPLLALLSTIVSLSSASNDDNRQAVFRGGLPLTTANLSAARPDDSPSPVQPLNYHRARKIAIIGAGPGGTSAAFFLSKAQSKLESLGFGAQGLDVTLFERDERIGGRTAVVRPYDDESMPAVEVGASIFADVNKNLQRASRLFNLTTGAKIGEPGMTGIWDGQQFLIEGLDDGWWNSAKMFWRYGYSPLTTQKLVRKLVDAFLRLYDPSFMHRGDAKSKRSKSGYPWRTIEDLAKAMQLDELAAQNAGAYFYNSGVSKLFTEEIIEAATLVNYGQEIYSIHGVGGSVSLAASGATGVVEGNYKIFESMLGACDALRLRLGIHGEVTGLAHFKTANDALRAGKTDIETLRADGMLVADSDELTDEGRTTKWWLGTKSGYGSLFDAVFIAAPWHSAGITLLNTHAVIPTPAYVHLHVTLVITKANQASPAYFGRGEKDAIPNSILTSHTSIRQEHRRKEEDKRRKGKGEQNDKPPHEQRAWTSWWPWSGGDGNKRGPRLDFNSLTFLGTIDSRTEPGKQDHIVKIFSSEALSDEKLGQIFGQGNVAWVHRKEWDAYPYLTPRQAYPKIQVDENLYFLNAIETLVSTMETATVSARNAVALYLQQEYGDDFVHGGKDCPWETKGKESADNDDDDDDEDDDEGQDWAAWGCRSA